jgi:hypothetical protein
VVIDSVPDNKKVNYTRFTPHHNVVWSRGWYVVAHPPQVPLAYYNAKGLDPKKRGFDLMAQFGSPCISKVPIWVRTRDLGWWATHILPALTCSVTLVSSDGTEDVPNAVHGGKAILDSPFVTAWYAQNVVLDHPKLKAIPVGLPVHYGFPGSPDSQDTLETLNRLWANRTAFEDRPLKILYDKGTFHENGSSRRDKFRSEAFKTLQNCEIISPMKPMVNPETWKMYAHYPFAVAVTGVGWDTYRLWELLYFGTVPIIKRGPLSESFKSTHLPVIVVDSWEEVCGWDIKQLEILRNRYKEWIANSHKWLEPSLWIPRQGHAMDELCDKSPGCTKTFIETKDEFAGPHHVEKESSVVIAPGQHPVKKKPSVAISPGLQDVKKDASVVLVAP